MKSSLNTPIVSHFKPSPSSSPPPPPLHPYRDLPLGQEWNDGVLGGANSHHHKSIEALHGIQHRLDNVGPVVNLDLVAS
jgi:hypothetical protein